MNRPTRREALKLAAALPLGAAAGSAVAADGEDKYIFRLSYRRDDGMVIPSTDGKWGLTPDAADGTVGKVDDAGLREQVKKSLDTRKLGPAILMVHGFMFDPAHPLDDKHSNPHRAIFHFNAERGKHYTHNFGWPLGLTFRQQPWLPIAFGWNSNPGEFNGYLGQLGVLARASLEAKNTLTDDEGKRLRKRVLDPLIHSPITESADALDKSVGELSDLCKKVARGLPYYPRIFNEEAPPAATQAAGVIRIIRELEPNRPVHLIGHSLGTRVVVQAVKALADDEALASVKKVVLIGGAERSENARDLLKALPAGHGVRFYNFTTRRDRVLDIFGERNYDPKPGEDPAMDKPVIGLRGLGAESKVWIDLELDTDQGEPGPFIRWLRRDRTDHEKVRGVHEFGVLNHWYCFTSKANLNLYAAILQEKDKDWSIEAISKGMASLK